VYIRRPLQTPVRRSCAATPERNAIERWRRNRSSWVKSFRRLGAREDSVSNASCLRHMFGTRWLQAGGDIYKRSNILGHSTVAVTEAHYAHLLKEDLVAASQQVKSGHRPPPPVSGASELRITGGSWRTLFCLCALVRRLRTTASCTIQHRPIVVRIHIVASW